MAAPFQNTDRILQDIDNWLNPEIDVSDDRKILTQPKVSKADDRFRGRAIRSVRHLS